MRESISFVLFPEPSISGRSDELRVGDYGKAIARWPQFQNPNGLGFRVEAERNSPVLHDILQFLKECGKEPYLKRCPPRDMEDASHFGIQCKRIFEEKDINTVKLLVCSPRHLIASAGRHMTDGTLCVARAKILKRSFGRVLISGIPSCTDKLKNEISSQDFNGLSYRPIIVDGKLPPMEQLWEVWSDVKLPPMENRLIDEKGEDFHPTESKSCVLEDLCFPPQLCFKEESVKVLGNVDVAVTHEHLGWGPRHTREPFLIVSQRFRRWCESRKLKTDWWPVTLI